MYPVKFRGSYSIKNQKEVVYADLRIAFDFFFGKK